DATPHQLEAEKQEVGLDHVAPAVRVDLGETPGLPERLDLCPVDTLLPRQTDQLREQVKPTPHAVGTEVRDEVVEVVVHVVRVAVAEAFAEVARHHAAVAERGELEHRKIEAPPV